KGIAEIRRSQTALQKIGSLAQSSPLERPLNANVEFIQRAGLHHVRLKRLARDAQVLCVTHLAQIASFADHHFYVEKSARGGRTVTTVRPLEGEKERAEELARMLSGSQITDAALKHAATMLRQAAG
ncbi:MAG: hypothetical protein LAO04_22325, partial [Acidobacteriia bacterium]|nr:hypothetical protein [Terriglobia bacterium]